MTRNISYKYYLFEDTFNVRVIFDKNGLKRGAQVPDAATQRIVS